MKRQSLLFALVTVIALLVSPSPSEAVDGSGPTTADNGARVAKVHPGNIVRIVKPRRGQIVRDAEFEIHFIAGPLAAAEDLMVSLNGKEASHLFQMNDAGLHVGTVSVLDYARYGRNALTFKMRSGGPGSTARSQMLDLRTTFFTVQASPYAPPPPPPSVDTKIGHQWPRPAGSGYGVQLPDRLILSDDAQQEIPLTSCNDNPCNLLWVLVLNRDIPVGKNNEKLSCTKTNGCLTVVKSIIFLMNSDGRSSLKDFILDLTTDDLVIINDISNFTDASLRPSYIDEEVIEALIFVGGPPSFGVSQTKVKFSLVGYPGAPANRAFVRLSPTGSDTGKTGALAANMNLLLIDDGQGRFVPMSQDFVKFDTGAVASTGTSTTNTMTVGNATYPSKPLPAGVHGGFHVVTLDRGALTLRANETYMTNADDPSVSQLALELMVEALAGAASDDSALVLLASIGAPLSDPFSQEALLAADPFGLVGGTRHTFQRFDQLDADHGYALVGRGASCNDTGPQLEPAACPVRGLETSFLMNPTRDKVVPGRLRGMLARERLGFYYWPIETAPMPIAAFELYEILSASPSPWPYPVGQTEANVWQCLSKTVCNCDDLRLDYTNETIKVATIRSDVNKAPQCGDPTTFARIQEELTKNGGELDFLSLAQGYLNSGTGDLALMMNKGSDSYKADLNLAAQQVLTDTRPKEDSAQLFFKNVFENLISKLGTFDPQLRAPLGTASAVLNSLVDHATFQGGQQSVAQFAIPLKVAEMQNAFDDAMDGMITQLGIFNELVYWDWHRLQAIGSGIKDPNNAQWEWNGIIAGQAKAAFKLSAFREIYETLMGIPFGVVLLEDWLDDDPWRAALPSDRVASFPRDNYQPSQTLAVETPDGNHDVYLITTWPPRVTGGGGKGPSSDLWTTITSQATGGGTDEQHLATYVPWILEKWRLPRRSYCLDEFNCQGEDCCRGLRGNVCPLKLCSDDDVSVLPRE